MKVIRLGKTQLEYIALALDMLQRSRSVDAVTLTILRRDLDQIRTNPDSNTSPFHAATIVVAVAETTN